MAGDAGTKERQYAQWQATWATELKEKPKGIGYSDLSVLLDKQLREVSDVAKTDPARCFVENNGPTITFPSENSI
jgi:hypothetical protein